ncbi:MAG: TonB-dependent receptor [Pseudomonadota bacterium]|nr:TonB-dependent receptor [Pseudomonadota bacterium]
MKSRTTLLASAIATAFGSVALPGLAAEEQADPYHVDEIVVTSSRVPIPLRQLGTSVSVITAAEIEMHGNLALTDVLRQLPAIATTNTGGAGKNTSLRIRGEEGFRTLTIIDGLRLSDPSSPQVGAPMEHLLSNGIGRVEILRGPQGLSYGADAGGIINISSRQAEPGFQANLDAQGGKFGTQQYSATVGAGNERADFFASATDYRTDGFNTAVGDNVTRDADGYDNTTIHLRGGLNLNEEWRIDLVHRDVSGDSEYDTCNVPVTFAPTHDCIGITDQQATRGAIGYDSGNFTHSLSYATTRTDRDNLAEGLSAFTSEGELKRWEYVGTATNLPGFDLVFGGDLEEASNDGVGRDNTGVYGEVISDFSDNLHLTAGARHDDNDDFGTNTSYRVSGAYVHDLASGNTVKFRSSYGTGFRAPSPYEIAYNAGEFAYPPASLVKLQQETSKGHEFGVEYRSHTLQLDATWFDQDVEDAIFFDLANYSGYLQDIGRSTSKGIELSAVVSIAQWHLTANHTWNDTELPNGQPRRRRPEHLTNLGVSYFGMNDKLNLNAFYRISRDSFDQVGAAMVQLDDFEVLDLSATFNLTDSVQVYGRIENALDEDYREVAGFNTAGRAAYVGFRLNYSGL